MKSKNIFNDFHPIVNVLLGGSILTSIALGMFVPFFAIYLVKYTEMHLAFVGFIIGLGALAGTVGGFLGGSLSDRIGRKKVMLGSLYISFFIYFGYLFTASPWFLFILTILKGFIGAFFDPSSKALIADFTPPEKRVKVFSIRYLMINIGFAIGPLIGTYLGAKDSNPFVFFVVSLIYLTYAIVLQFIFIYFNVNSIRKETSTVNRVTFRSSIKAIVFDRKLLYFIIGGVLAMTVHGQFSVALSQYFYIDFIEGISYLAMLWTIHSITIIVLGVPLTKWLEKVQSISALSIASIMFVAGLIGFAFSSNFSGFVIAMIIFTIGEMIIIPSEYAIVDRITPEHLRGTYYGAMSFTAIGSFLGPSIAGTILSAYGGRTMFLSFILFTFISILLYWKGHRYTIRKSHTATVQIKEV